MDLSSLAVNYHAMLMQSPDPSVLIALDSARLLDVNLPAETMLGRTRTELLSLRIDELCPPEQPNGRCSRDMLAVQLASAGDDRGRMFALTMSGADGRLVPCEALLIRLPVEGTAVAHGRLVDISPRLLAEHLRTGQSDILELIARGAPLKQIMDQLVCLIEAQSPGVLCSVLQLDEDGITVHPLAGCSLPDAFMNMLDGLLIGPAAGSCGAAMFNRELTVVPDIRTDSRWAPYATLAEPFGLRACWSTPIMPENQQVLGSFAMYYREVRTPTEAELALIATASHLAGIALQRHRRERELKLHREHLEVLVAARTAALTSAVERADRINRELSGALATLSKAKDELVRRDKLAALGVLVAGIAHELNTPIGNSVVAATSLAERTHDLRAHLAQGLRRSELERFLDAAGEAGDLLVRNLKRAASLVAGFKQIAVDQASAERRQFSLTALLTDLAAPLQVAAKAYHVRMEHDIAASLQMDSYPGPLSQVVTELVDNCLAHAFTGRKDGVIRIEARADGETLAITVSDNGTGMAPEVQSNIYDPFFTTNSAGGRSGLGLHVVHNIVSNVLGGSITLDSAEEAGAHFTLLLPATAPERPGHPKNMPSGTS